LTTAYTFPHTMGLSTTIYAKWTADSQTLTFNSNGGSAVAPITQDYGTTVNEPTAPTKEGHTFGGWYSDAGLTTAYTFPHTMGLSTTIYAKWTADSQTLTFDSNGGSAVAPITQAYGTTVNEPTAPTKEGHTFAGWYSDAGLTTAYNFPHTMGLSTTIYAKWTADSQTLSFNSNGGSAVTPITQDYGTSVAAPTPPTKEGHTFGGWYSDDGTFLNEYTFPHTMGLSTTIHAKWIVASYTVTFEPQNGDPAFTQEVDFGALVPEPDPAPTQTYYNFVGWFDAASGGTQWNFADNRMGAADMTLYAYWDVANPTVPILQAPGNGDALHTNRPDFDWLDVPNATGYQFQVSRNNTFTQLAQNITIAKPTSSFTPTVNLPSGQTLFWRVRARFGAVYGGWSDVWDFSTGNPPSVPALLLPANNALSATYTPRLDWRVVTVPLNTTFDRYELQVDDDPAFGSPLTVDVPGLANHEYTIPAPDALDPNTRYYWRARAWNTVGDYSAWSAAWSFRTVMLPPALDGSTPCLGWSESIHNRRPLIDWPDAPGAAGYNIQVSWTKTIYKTTASQFMPPADLRANDDAYWRIRSLGPNGPSAWSEICTFRTGNPPSVPALLLPANNALSATYTPRLDWNQVTLPLGTTFDRYELQVDDDPAFGSPIDGGIFINGLANHEYTFAAPLDPNTRYHWRVRSWNTDGDWSVWSSVRSFRTAISMPILIEPGNGDIFAGLRPVFDWEDSPGASGYTIQISRNATFSSLVVNVTLNTPISSYTPTVNLPAGIPLWWRVRANGANGPSAWSVETFQVITP
jgi:uncharacterized repeat protein (TIGR02543 family)